MNLPQLFLDALSIGVLVFAVRPPGPGRENPGVHRVSHRCAGRTAAGGLRGRTATACWC